MRITVLHGSPKVERSISMQYVRYIKKTFPQHQFDIIPIAQQIKRIEENPQVFQEIIHQIASSDGILWAFPIYILLTHASYKRFIEMIWEQGVEAAFRHKYTAALSTSIHFFDHTAHDYIHAICDDLEMKFVGAFSADIRDLLQEQGQKQLSRFTQEFLDAIEHRQPTPRRYLPLVAREFEYRPGPVAERLDTNAQKIVILTDARPEQNNLIRMIERFRASFTGETEVINLHDLEIKGGCLGCINCGYDYQCAYLGKDDFIDFYNTRLKTADILIFAGAIRDRYLSSRWKLFFDRSFFNTHTPSLMGKQFGFIISGPFSQSPHIRQIMEAWIQFQYSNLVGFVTDEFGESADIDGLLQSLAGQLVRLADNKYTKPRTFLGVAGMKIFRDDVWGRLRFIFQADHRAYQRLGLYDFPQNDLRMRVFNAMTTILLYIPGFREKIIPKIRKRTLQSYQELLKSDQP